MKIVVTYIDFHWDNYQGARGKLFELNCSFDVPDTLKAVDIFEYVHQQLENKVKTQRPFPQNNKYCIQRVELI